MNLCNRFHLKGMFHTELSLSIKSIYTEPPPLCQNKTTSDLSWDSKLELHMKIYNSSYLSATSYV